MDDATFIMDDTTFTSDAASMKRRILLDQLITIRSLMGREDDDSRDVIKDLAKKGVTLNREQLTSLSTEFLLTVLLDVMLLRLLDEGEEGGVKVPLPELLSDQQQVVDDAAAKKRKKAAAKKKRYKRNKAAVKHKKSRLMSWLGGGIISVIIMVAFSFISTPIVTLSLFQPSDGSGEGKAPPALPPSASTSKSLRQEDIKSKNEASTSPDIISSPLAAVVPPPVFAPIAVSNRRMKSDEMRASTCFDTPNWKDKWGDGCDDYEDWDLCPYAEDYEGDMGPASTHCCICDGGGSKTCEDFRLECQKYINVLDLGLNEIDLVAPVCKKAESFCCEAADHDVKLDVIYRKYTVGLYNECKCDFWSRLCEDTQVGEACDYAAEYCCGDYKYFDSWGFEYVNSPTCYCDFFNYAQEEFGHTLKPKALNISKEFENPCGQIQDLIAVLKAQVWDYRLEFERPSLEAIYNQTHGQNWTNSAGWMNEPDHCNWHGITCDSDSFITSIDLRDNNLVGEFPVYTRNTVDGDFYAESQWALTKYGLASLFNLKTLDLSDNKLTGTIEYAPLYNLHLLTHFDVSGNQLSGEIDALVSPSLTYADFHNNRFTSMRRFEKYKVSPLQTLRFCDVSNNAIQQDASDLLENIPPNIERFLASNNQMHGNLPASLNSLSKLSQFDMSSNALSGSFPGFTESFATLQKLDMSKQTNGFIGSIPDNIWRSLSLKVLNLADNRLTGSIPSLVGNLAALEEFDLSNNLFSGQIPSQMGQLEGSLKHLCLSNNKLTGTIEYRPLYNLSSLIYFDVSGNQLRGEVDALVTPSLTHADFHNNRFTSMQRFEQNKQSFQTLRFCDVSNNAIKHKSTDLLENIPPNIEQFFASNNQIYGSLPESLNNLPKLRQFNMSSNALSGSLPVFADSFLSLQQLDLSNQNRKNGFIGSIPEDLWRFQSLKVLNLASNKIAGTISPNIGKMTALEEIDLSNNLLSGQIPSQMGQLEAILRRLVLANNILSGIIPAQIGQLQGASVMLEGNHFHDSSIAPLGLCTLRSVVEFDLANDTQLCPVERNALSDFYYSTKGAEWTDSTNWLDEYTRYCDWHGVRCVKGRVVKLELSNNGLSGRLSKSIGDLTFIRVLDLSDNDIKGSIPTEIGKLSYLTYLRLSYNALTGTAEGLRELTKLQLLHLQSNRITGMPTMTQLDMSNYNKSTFVTDCGVPSAFDETPECKDCTMCCNANDDCYPQEKTRVANFGYSKFAAVFFACFIVICCVVILFLYFVGKRKNRGNARTMSEERRLEEDDKYALSRIGKDSVYSYFVTDKVLGWLAAFATLAIQVAILAFFVMASEANLQKDTIDIQFTWKCPRDSDVCDNKADLTNAGWVIFSMLMLAFLAKDMINGCKLIYHSSKVWHTVGARIRYFIGGMSLCSITLFALYVSTVYNNAIATSNTAIIANSVIVLFIMEIDEYIFSAVDAINDKWTEHAADTKVSDMEKEIARQRAQIESQQEELDNQRKDLGMLREAVEKIQESQATAAVAAEASASDSENAECEGDTGGQLMEQVDQITMPCEAEQSEKEFKAAAATSSRTITQCTAQESITTHAAELEDTDSDAAAGKEGTTNEMKDENALQTDEIVLENGSLHSWNV